MCSHIIVNLFAQFKLPEDARSRVKKVSVLRNLCLKVSFWICIIHGNVNIRSWCSWNFHIIQKLFLKMHECAGVLSIGIKGRKLTFCFFHFNRWVSKLQLTNMILMMQHLSKRQISWTFNPWWSIQFHYAQKLRIWWKLEKFS